MKPSSVLLNRILDWLNDEKFEIDDITTDKTDFHLVLVNPYSLGIPIQIGKPKEAPYIQIAVRTTFPPEIKEGLKNLGEKESLKFVSWLQRELLKFEVDHTVLPNKKNPEEIEIKTNVYVEDITRSIFMGTIQKIKFSVLFMLWSFMQKLVPENEDIGKRFGDASSPMYG